jgi:hypothetical protein
VEGPVSTRGQNFQSVANAKHVTYIPAGDDPYGPYREANIELEGQLAQVKTTALDPLAGSTACRIRMAEDGETEDLIPDTKSLEGPS